MNFNPNEIDWSAVDQDTQIAAASSNAATTTKEASKMLKPKVGFHYLRLIPAGNALQKKPYLHLVQHPMKVPREDGNGTRDVFVLCWSHVLNDLIKLGDISLGGSKEKQGTMSIVSYLGQVGKINTQEFEKFRTYGCPMCKAFNYLNQMGVDREFKNKFYPQEQYFFNVIHRSKQPDGMPSFGDDNVYIFRMGKQNGGRIVTTINTMRKQANVNYLDINTGRDLMIQAVGELLMRRYPLMQFMDMSTPLNLGERTIHNLLDILVQSHHEYQKIVNMMKVSYGQALQQYQYAIPGDSAVMQAYPPVVSEAVHQAQQAIAQAQNPSQFAGQQVQVPQTPPPTNPYPAFGGNAGVNQQPVQSMYNDGDGVEYRNGILVNKSTGQPMF